MEKSRGRLIYGCPWGERIDLYGDGRSRLEPSLELLKLHNLILTDPQGLLKLSAELWNKQDWFVTL